jgi:glutathione peroxidase
VVIEPDVIIGVNLVPYCFWAKTNLKTIFFSHFVCVMKKLKGIFYTLFLLLIISSVYVIIVNRNSANMTVRQKVLKALYPALMWVTKLAGANASQLSNTSAKPAVDFYSLKDTLNNDVVFDFAQLKGKKVLIVNTASDCGYTNQYMDLQKLYEMNKDSLVILGFPANDFKEQEKANDSAIANFCKINYGVTFPLMKKSSVVKGANQNPIFNWLSNATKNGWNEKEPSWNFSKYLINESGILIHYFDPSISPLQKEILDPVTIK